MIDANAILFLVEGSIKHTQSLFPELSHAQRLPHVLSELDSCLSTIRHFCGTDESIYVSDRVFDEGSLGDRGALARKGLDELKRYSNQERGQMHQILLSHFPEPMIIPEVEIVALRKLFDDPNVRPQDRDASLIVAACHLASNGERVIVVTSDPDFIRPLNILMAKGSVTFGDGCSFSTERIIYRPYFNFVLCLHDCCNMTSEVYTDIGITYLSAIIRRLAQLRRQDIKSSNERNLIDMLAIHTKSVQYKTVSALT